MKPKSTREKERQWRHRHIMLIGLKEWIPLVKCWSAHFSGFLRPLRSLISSRLLILWGFLKSSKYRIVRYSTSELDIKSPKHFVVYVQRQCMFNLAPERLSNPWAMSALDLVCSKDISWLLFWMRTSSLLLVSTLVSFCSHLSISTLFHTWFLR